MNPESDSTPLLGDSPCSQIKPCMRMWAVVDECGNINHTTIALRAEDSIKEWMDQEHAVTRLFLWGPCPSWEGYEAQGMSVQQVDIVPSANDQGEARADNAASPCQKGN